MDKQTSKIIGDYLRENFSTDVRWHVVYCAEFSFSLLNVLSELFNDVELRVICSHTHMSGIHHIGVIASDKNGVPLVVFDSNGDHDVDTWFNRWSYEPTDHEKDVEMELYCTKPFVRQYDDCESMLKEVNAGLISVGSRYYYDDHAEDKATDMLIPLISVVN